MTQAQSSPANSYFANADSDRRQCLERGRGRASTITPVPCTHSVVANTASIALVINEQLAIRCSADMLELRCSGSLERPASASTANADGVIVVYAIQPRRCGQQRFCARSSVCPYLLTAVVCCRCVGLKREQSARASLPSTFRVVAVRARAWRR